MVAPARVTQRIDTTAQREQRPVDIGAFDKSVPPIFRCAGPLASSQIDDAQCRHRMWLVDVGISVFLSHVNLKHGMGP